MSSTKSEPSKRKVVNADEAYMAMCTGALAVSHTSVRCRACEGHGFRELSLDDARARAAAIAAETDTKAREQLRKDLGAETTCQVCLGIGYTTQRRADRASAMDTMWTTVRCGRCRGCGEVLTPTDTSAERQDACLGCGGAAYIVPVSVKESGSTKNGRASRRESAGIGDNMPDADPIEPYSYEPEPDVSRGRIGAELDLARATDPQLAAALASYFGPEGDRWVNHRWGRGFAVWQHTPLAPQLAHHAAELSRRGSGHLCDVTALLTSAREQHERGQLPATRDGSMVRVLLGRVDVEARDLLQRMARVVDQVESAA